MDRLDMTSRETDNKYYRFIIEGKVVPYVRMTQRSKYVSTQAKRYLQWKEDFGWQLKEQMLDAGWTMIPDMLPLHIAVIYHVGEARNPEKKEGGFAMVKFDLSNVIKGVEDAAQGIVYQNDRDVDSLVSTRYWNAAGDYQITLVASTFQGGKNGVA